MSACLLHIPPPPPRRLYFVGSCVCSIHTYVLSIPYASSLRSLHTLINKKHGQEGFCFFRPALDIVSRVNLRAKCPYPIITIIVMMMMMTLSQHRTQQPMHPAHN